MGILGKKRIEASEFGASLALLLFTWWKDEGKTIFDSVIDKTSAGATKSKGAEEALVLGMFAVTRACESSIAETHALPAVLDSFHRSLYGLLIQDGVIKSRRVAPNLTLDGSVVAGEFESELVRPRYQEYRSAFSCRDPVPNLGRVVIRALGSSEEDGIAILRFANVASAVLAVMAETIGNLRKDYRIAL